MKSAKNKFIWKSIIYLGSLSIPVFALTSCNNSRKETNKDNTISQKEIDNQSVLINVNENELKQMNLKDIKKENIKFNQYDKKIYFIEIIDLIKEEKNKTIKIKYKLQTIDKKVFSLIRTKEINNIGINKQFINNLLNDKNSTFKIIDFEEEEKIDFSNLNTQDFLEPEIPGKYGIKIKNENMYIPEDLIIEFEYKFKEQLFDGNLYLKLQGKINDNIISDKINKKIEANLLPGVSMDYLIKKSNLKIFFETPENYSFADFKINEPLNREKIEHLIFKINKEKEDGIEFLKKYNLKIKKVLPTSFIFKNKTIKFNVYFEDNPLIIKDEDEEIKISFETSNFNKETLISEKEFENFLDKLIIENRFFEDEIELDNSILKNAVLYYSENGQIDENSIIVEENFLASKNINYFNNENLFSVNFNKITKNIEADINIFKNKEDSQPKRKVSKVLNEKINDINWDNLISFELRNKSKNKPIDKIKVNDFIFRPKRDESVGNFNFITVWTISLKDDFLDEEKELMKNNKRTIIFSLKNNVSQKIYSFTKVFELKK
ncbi:hypothetical protein DMC14_002620 [Metamycoplasma phocicerebrale]|uniref:Lipoprotein n=1 Tax=Metamycoplasma phocicerebrale TaxID=142649 RepID=A0A3Q9V9P5_9BACT|nr:hypothetical protein [Metamycoplasma phocicerebrale]AZZ65664.1 hypothetical protein DMC14_002620 [Metamycoplasma phocicerebrale]